MDKELKSYEALLEQSSMVANIITPAMADAIFSVNKHTVDTLSGKWLENTRKNLALYKEHGSLIDAFGGFGTNRAVIGVGAGPSFNRNKDVLKQIYEYNLHFPLEMQPFIIVASNKQFKPLLKMGIYPHFVLLIDAGDALYPQLCKDIPKNARESILIAGLHTSPRILNKWVKNGGQICFYSTGGEDEKKLFEKETKDDFERIHISQGGNVLNTLWILAGRMLGSTVYITVGNDLAFKYSKDKAERAKSFYADGDYRMNILNKRDEAQDNMAWMGFEMQKSAFMQNHATYDMTVMGTSRQMWVYKTWFEVQVAIWATKHTFHVYNCSEAGILGVLARETTSDAMFDRDNWFLIDELLPQRWHTRTLEQAFKDFVEAKYIWQTQMETHGVVDLVGASLAKTAGVKPAAPHILNPKSPIHSGLTL